MTNKTIGTEKVSIKDWPEVLRILENLKNPPRRTLLYSIPGSGKTTYAQSLTQRYEDITLTAGQFPDALFGKFLLRDGSTYWQDACATRAARPPGCLLILNEIHKAGGELESALHSVLDDASVCRFSLDNGEVVTPGEGFRVIATMNGSPDQLSEPVLDRFDTVLRCDMPHHGILRRLSPEAAAFLVNKIQNEPDNDLWTPKLSTRTFLAWEHLRKEGVSDELAAELCFGEGQGKTVLMSMIDAVRNTEGKVN